MSNRFAHGLFVISLDLELYWGVRDKRSLESYEPNLLGAPTAVEAILELFQRYDIHASWATVGALFLNDSSEFLTEAQARPGYVDSNLCPFKYVENEPSLDSRVHFSPALIKAIATTNGQEVSTHTFSHFYCAEKGANPYAFRLDIKAAQKAAHRLGIELKSIVFPRNQCREDFLPILSEAGITIFRGNPVHWAYRAAPESEQSFGKRALRLLDSYINITGHHTFCPRITLSKEIINVPSSLFLRPYAPKLALLEPLKIKRIKDSLKVAAQRKQGFHLWWHPHNFGTHLQQNLENLESILKTFKQLRCSLGMQSMNMFELGQNIKNGALLERT